jgi:hypothetical protein
MKIQKKTKLVEMLKPIVNQIILETSIIDTIGIEVDDFIQKSNPQLYRKYMKYMGILINKKSIDLDVQYKDIVKKMGWYDPGDNSDLYVQLTIGFNSRKWMRTPKLYGKTDNGKTVPIAIKLSDFGHEQGFVEFWDTFVKNR